MTLSAVLLAGGESRRMGTEKAMVIFQGEPLWQRQLRLLRQLEPEKIFLSARMERAWRPADIELLLDEAPSRGPISGIAAALTRMETSHLVVLAVDMPFVMIADLLNLVRRARAGCGVVPATRKRAEPLAAIYPKPAQQELAAAMSRNDTSLQPLVRQLAEMGKVDLVHLRKGEAERYSSVNMPDDLIARTACR